MIVRDICIQELSDENTQLRDELKVTANLLIEEQTERQKEREKLEVELRMAKAYSKDVLGMLHRATHSVKCVPVGIQRFLPI